jgi:hypothetical protein
MIFAILPAFIGAAVIFAIIFAVVAIVEGRHTAAKSGIIKQIYFYLVSILTLLISVVAIGFIVQTLLKSTAFPRADSYDKASVTPPSLYLTSAKFPSETSTITCATGCDLTESQKGDIANWSENYQSWKQSQDMTARRQRDLVAAISVLLVALPLFYVHYRIIQKENAAQTPDQRSLRMIRPTYFYIATFVGLGMIITFGSLLINLVLKTYLFPKANTADNSSDSYMMAVSPETSGAGTIQDCATACNLDAKYVASAEQYQVDYQDWQNRNRSAGRNDSEAARDIAFLVAAIPLFWYHWSKIRKESRDSSAPNQANN